jgi:hypothetical protein
MAEKYLGNEHYFVHKFFQRKSFTPSNIEPVPPPALLPSNDAGEPEEYMYYEPQAPEAAPAMQPEGREAMLICIE